MSQTRDARIAIVAAFALNGGMLGLWASRIPAFVERFSLGADTLGLLLLCVAAGAFLAFPVAGRMTDQRGAATVTRILSIALPLCAIALALAPSVLVLGIVLALFGACFGGMDVAMNGWGTEVERAMDRPIMSSFHAAFSLGTAISAATAPVAIALELPVWAHFAAVALPATALTLWLERVPWQSQIVEDGPAFALPRGPLIAAGLIAMASAVGEGSMIDWSALYLIEETGTTEARSGIGLAVFSAFMVGTRLTADRIVARIGPIQAARISGIIAVAGAGLLALSPGFAVALIAMALMGIGCAALFPLAFSRAAADPHIPPGTGIASVATLGYGAILLGPPVIGWIAAATSLATAMIYVAVLSLLIVLLAPSLARP
ncbi:MFS transporter [Palleronia caenipelagi]|uniref:MFS transporter n=1 Tax=Palleronia caenipelagi TaxID=2489174 RepID=A0A547Q6Z7_9RHOB|nr:MFS transporter [Palleronia caenipelagi]TRD22160.1 MFS transporter [Palleronia caenipelagi]